MLLDGPFDLERIDRVAADLEHVLRTALEQHGAERAEASEIAGAEPPVVGDSSRRSHLRRPSTRR
jgi:hypothetical protein